MPASNSSVKRLARQIEVEAGVDQIAHLVLAEHAAGVMHRVSVGIEWRQRVALPVVPAHQVEDLSAGACRILVARLSPDRPHLPLPLSAAAQGSPAARASSS